MNELYDRIVKAVNKIRKEAVRKNFVGVGGESILISENDLCCLLFKELYKPKEYSIHTEVTIAEDLGHIMKHDLVICKNDKIEYELSIYGNPKNWDCKEYLAVMEMKLIWFDGPSRTKYAIREDLLALSKLKEKSKSFVIKSRYMIMFDYRGHLDSKELINLTGKRGYDTIHLFYVDIKNDKFYIVKSNGVTIIK